MLYHIPKPFFRKSRKTWYVEISGRQINLGPDKEAAFQRYHQLMACPPEKRFESVQTGQGIKLCQLFDSFLDWLQKNRSAATYGWYQYRLQRFADQYPELTVVQLRPFHVQERADSYEDHATTTTRNYIRTIKRCLKWAKRQGYIDADPVAGMEVPAGEARDVFIPRAKFDELLTLAPDPALRDLMEVTYASGCRPQESLRLEIRHVDLKHQRWVIPRTEAKGKKAPRIVYLSEEAAKITERLIAGRTDDYVFRNGRGHKWTVSAVNCAFKRIRDRLGIKEMERLKIQIPEADILVEEKKVKKTRMCNGEVKTKTKAEVRCEAKRKVRNRLAQNYAPKYSLYALRHSWATNALQNGVDSLTVEILMGHQDPSMLAKVYQHLGHNPDHMLSEAQGDRSTRHHLIQASPTSGEVKLAHQFLYPHIGKYLDQGLLHRRRKLSPRFVRRENQRPVSDCKFVDKLLDWLRYLASIPSNHQTCILDVLSKATLDRLWNPLFVLLDEQQLLGKDGLR